MRNKLDNVEQREKAQERYFKNQYLNMLPAQSIKEVVRAFKRRIKIPPKIYTSQLMLKTLAQRVAHKAVSRLPFPVPLEIDEYLEALKGLDDTANMPQSLEGRLWDQMVKLRRQKIETELKLRALHLQISTAQSINNNYGIQLRILNEIKEEAIHKMDAMRDDYVSVIVENSMSTERTHTCRVYYIPVVHHSSRSTVNRTSLFGTSRNESSKLFSWPSELHFNA